MLTATILYNAIARDYTKSLSETSQQPSVERATQYFLANIGKVTSASQLVNNSQLYNYVMTAFGLQDMSYAKALIVKVLNGGATSSGFAASMNDPRYMALVTAFDFAANGATTTSSSSSTAAATTIDNYNQQTLETQNCAGKSRRANGALFRAHGPENHQPLQHPRRSDSVARSSRRPSICRRHCRSKASTRRRTKSRNC